MKYTSISLPGDYCENIIVLAYPEIIVKPGPRIRQLQTNCYAPVLRFPAPLCVVRFSRKCV